MIHEHTTNESFIILRFYSNIFRTPKQRFEVDQTILEPNTNDEFTLQSFSSNLLLISNQRLDVAHIIEDHSTNESYKHYFYSTVFLRSKRRFRIAWINDGYVPNDNCNDCSIRILCSFWNKALDLLG
jgi:hypothetical protein